MKGLEEPWIGAEELALAAGSEPPRLLLERAYMQVGALRDEVAGLWVDGAALAERVLIMSTVETGERMQRQDQAEERRVEAADNAPYPSTAGTRTAAAAAASAARHHTRSAAASCGAASWVRGPGCVLCCRHGQAQRRPPPDAGIRYAAPLLVCGEIRAMLSGQPRSASTRAELPLLQFSGSCAHSCQLDLMLQPETSAAASSPSPRSEGDATAVTQSTCRFHDVASCLPQCNAERHGCNLAGRGLLYSWAGVASEGGYQRADSAGSFSAMVVPEGEGSYIVTLTADADIATEHGPLPEAR